MTAECWQDPLARAVTACIDGSRDPDRDARGRPLLDDDLLVLINGYWEPLDFTVPPMDTRWRLALDTAHPTAPEAPVPPGMPVTVGAWSLLLLVGARRSGE
jgi:glycogen operon protein